MSEPASGPATVPANPGPAAAVAAKRAVIYLRVSTADQAHGADSAEGYSIPAQREACARKAADLGAAVVAEFADRGESAKTTARPQLQKMLARLAEHKDVEYVIVHKVDRLARNRADDVQIQLAIERAGARLISVSESVDDTPSGRLVRNIMADLAEFYSANLATEILKGSTQKARLGGTPFKAPLGYKNVRYQADGREIRTVEIDEERAPLVRRAFQLYATGEYSLKRLHEQLTAEGLTTRATPKRPAGPLALSKFAELLRNRYYLGLVSYRGIEHPGKHPALVGAQLFDRVQMIIADRDRHALKPRRHQHYLRGLLCCARCGSRLQYTTGRGHGGEFEYYVCSKRHKGGGCDLPYLAAIAVEERIEQAWPQWVQLDALDGEAVGSQLHALVVGDKDQTDRLLRAQRRLARLDKERLKLVQMAYADAIPIELLKAEQQRVTREREEAVRDEKEAQDTGAKIMETYHQAQALMQRGAEAYRLGGPTVRRLLTRAFLARIEVDTDDEQATLASPWHEIRDAAAHVRKLSARPPEQHPRRRPSTTRRGSRANPGLLSEGQGSNKNPLVELRGLEPLTPSMPWRCATSCATAPESALTGL
jgi:site-specific DNA recombinase